MGVRGLFEGWHLVVLIVLIILLFGWKRLPDAARSLGRSMRIFKAEVEEMKGDKPSAASKDTVRGERVEHATGHRDGDAVHREADADGRGEPGHDDGPGERVHDLRDADGQPRVGDTRQPRT